MSGDIINFSRRQTSNRVLSKHGIFSHHLKFSCSFVKTKVKRWEEEV